jgi:ABC-type transporter Mla MlaB component
MLKISLVELQLAHVTLQLEGQVIKDWVEELRKQCEDTLSLGNRLTLDLAGVTFVDPNGVVFLMSLLSRQVDLVQPQLYVAELLKRQL